MFSSIFLILVTVLVQPNNCGRILAVMPTPSYSHQIVYQPLWHNLLNRGHHITLLTTNPMPVNSTNLTQINWNFAYSLWHEKHNVSDIIKQYNKNIVKGWIRYLKMINTIIDKELSELPPYFFNQTFDVAIVEILNPAMIGFSYKFKCPLIGVSPMDISNYAHGLAGNAIGSALFTDNILSGFDERMNFFERVANTILDLAANLFFDKYFFPTQTQIARKYFGDGMPDLQMVQKNASLLFLNTNPIIHGVRPLMPNVLSIGGGVHIKDSFEQELPEYIQDFLDRSVQGVIYMSLGTNLKSENLPKATKQIFIDVFKNVPYGVLWKFENDNEVQSNRRMLVRKWLPQQQILNHKNVKLFITQGGLQSLEESIYYKVPIIGIPSMVDQFPNIRRLVRLGLGLELNLNQLNIHELEKAIIAVITNKKYKITAEKLSGLLKEQKPFSGMKQAVKWVEYVMAHKGARFLQQTPISTYQYLFLDVFAMVFIVGSILIYFQYKVLLLFVKKVIRKKKLE